MALRFIQEEKPEEAVIETISDGLSSYNVSFAGADNRKDLWLIGRDENGVVQAGLKGISFWSWMFVDWLWIAEAHRTHGYGAQLLEQAESIAKERGCSGIFLDTYSFQAPDFYQKHGYTEFGRLKDCPIKGKARIYLSKIL